MYPARKCNARHHQRTGPEFEGNGLRESPLFAVCLFPGKPEKKTWKGNPPCPPSQSALILYSYILLLIVMRTVTERVQVHCAVFHLILEPLSLYKEGDVILRRPFSACGFRPAERLCVESAVLDSGDGTGPCHSPTSRAQSLAVGSTSYREANLAESESRRRYILRQSLRCREDPESFLRF